MYPSIMYLILIIPYVKYRLHVEIQAANGSSHWQARVRRREGEKRFTGREDATSSLLERQIRKDGEEETGKMMRDATSSVTTS